jgi:hypothetical protein
VVLDTNRDTSVWRASFKGKRVMKKNSIATLLGELRSELLESLDLLLINWLQSTQWTR